MLDNQTTETTNALKTQRKERQEELIAILDGLYKDQAQHLKDKNKEVANKLTALLTPKYPIGVNIGLESLRFFTAEKAVNEKAEHMYPDFGSELTIYNRQNYVHPEPKFLAEINYGSCSMEFGGKGSYQITKFQMMFFISNEIDSQGDFYKYLISVCEELRERQKPFHMYERELSQINDAIRKEESEELRKNFFDNLKQGNWYKTKESTNSRQTYAFFIEKLSPKTITLQYYAENSRMLDTKRLPIEEAYSLLRNKELVSESPIFKQVNILN